MTARISGCLRRVRAALRLLFYHPARSPMNFVAAALIIGFPWAQPPRPDVDRKEDVIYGRKFGTALTMDVYVPKAKKNGAGVIFAVSGGWFSAKQPVRPAV